MEKIKVGYYVRTKEGLIDKVIIDYKGCCNSPNCNCKHVSCEHNYYDEKDIIKSSDNLIDLIEVGDYVNGYKVDFIQNGYVVFNHNHPYKINIYPKDIKDIVTKEQFESVKYEVE